MREQLLVGVCTCRRPLMLEECLDSLTGQSVPADVAMAIVVVDNESFPARRDQVGRTAARTAFPLHYVHEPRRGIAIARNAILDCARELGADWIAMIDDDEVAAPDWIERLMAPEHRETPVLWGRQVMVDPELREPLGGKKETTRWRELDGTTATFALTNNVRFSMRLLERGLRFDESFGAMGGEDVEFFTRAHLLGFEIRRSARAITYEVAHPERSTFFGGFYRQYWTAASEVYRRRVLGHHEASQESQAPPLISDLIGGLWRIARGLWLTPFQPQKSRRLKKSGARRLGRAAGSAVGLTPFRPKPYRRVVGR